MELSSNLWFWNEHNPPHKSKSLKKNVIVLKHLMYIYFWLLIYFVFEVKVCLKVINSNFMLGL